MPSSFFSSLTALGNLRRVACFAIYSGAIRPSRTAMKNPQATECTKLHPVAAPTDTISTPSKVSSNGIICYASLEDTKHKTSAIVCTPRRQKAISPPS